MRQQPTPAELFIYCHRELLTCLDKSIYAGVHSNAKECHYAIKRLDKELPSLFTRKRVSLYGVV